MLFADIDEIIDCTPSEKPQTNADRFRAMSNEEQQNYVRKFWEIEDFANWLQQPAEEGER